MEHRERLRCAIYTRKSTEEGLDQVFNSLHAQREYCEAYVQSQGGEGWTVVRTRYDDGGFSGASMGRPGLQHLLHDVEAKRIDVVVVYKVDRLTRSLADFARILECLDKHSAAFVSVTQAFNTNSSMGRLTLNILLSFAQFEREVTGERIRDKVLASKVKGMWMGGTVPLGYDPPDASGDRRLRVNEEGAAVVRFIFERFTVCRSLCDLQQHLMDNGIRTKAHKGQNGTIRAGAPFSRGALRYLLQNKTYLGLICHKGAVYAGRHEALIDQRLFDTVQTLLSHRADVWKRRAPNLERAKLHGRIFDEFGQKMVPQFIPGKRRTYGYYVAPRLAPGLSNPDGLGRVPCKALDDLVQRRVVELAGVGKEEITTEVLRDLVVRVEIHSASVQVVINLKALNDFNSHGATVQDLEKKLWVGDRLLPEPSRFDLVRLSILARLKMHGGRTWVEDAQALPDSPANAIKLAAVKKLRAAHAAYAPMRKALSEPKADRPANIRLHRLDWVFLSPKIQAAILNGRLSAEVLAKLNALKAVPLSWSEQNRVVYGTSDV
ncbi:recombinase family protein [Brevundimonas terrae]|uniref:recombinase family protein n=3 Tax=Brevundimonas terrae TaxID=363631 RepID=UPI001420DFDA|nr:recombinase family protein [Brevundimonas terrae]NIJ28009.1 DNA invertase Pin-like site-specific DNA recombinase [Brevundimonas terrae]